MRDIKEEIRRVKERLNHLINLEPNKLTSKDIIRLSQELDLLIKKYYAV